MPLWTQPLSVSFSGRTSPMSSVRSQDLRCSTGFNWVMFPGSTPLASRIPLRFGASSSDSKQGKRRRSSMWPRCSRWVNLYSTSLMLSTIPMVWRPSPQVQQGGECMPIVLTTLILLCGSRNRLCLDQLGGRLSPHQQHWGNQRDRPRCNVAFRGS